MTTRIRRPRGLPASLVQVNMTPLVDVMLTVLLLFMVTAPLVLEGPDVRLPRVRAAQVPLKDTRAVVTVRADGRVYFAKRDITEQIEAVLLSDPLVLRERRLYVRGDENASFESVSRVLAAARRAGVHGLNLVVDPRLLHAHGRLR